MRAVAVYHIRPEDDPLNVSNNLCNSVNYRALILTMAYNLDLTVHVHVNDGKVHVAKAMAPLYGGDVHTLPLNIDPATIPSAGVEMTGTEFMAIREVGPWDDRA